MPALVTSGTYFFHPFKSQDSIGGRPARDGVGDDVNVETTRNEIDDRRDDADVRLDADDDESVDRRERRRRQNRFHFRHEHREAGLRDSVDLEMLPEWFNGRAKSLRRTKAPKFIE